jgi:hypothetical protein
LVNVPDLVILQNTTEVEEPPSNNCLMKKIKLKLMCLCQNYKKENNVMIVNDQTNYNDSNVYTISSDDGGENMIQQWVESRAKSPKKKKIDNKKSKKNFKKSKKN